MEGGGRTLEAQCAGRGVKWAATLDQPHSVRLGLDAERIDRGLDQTKRRPSAKDERSEEWRKRGDDSRRRRCSSGGGRADRRAVGSRSRRCQERCQQRHKKHRCSECTQHHTQLQADIRILGLNDNNENERMQKQRSEQREAAALLDEFALLDDVSPMDESLRSLPVERVSSVEWGCSCVHVCADVWFCGRLTADL